MNEVTLHAGDNRETLKRMIADGTRVHSVVTDPPYALDSIVKRFGKGDAKAAKSDNNDGSFSRLSGGFMGKTWDGTEIERDPKFWALILEILLPGGFCFAFSGSRTGHRQACAMEEAGFIMHPMHAWAFGSGFPKAHNASRAIAKHLKPETCGAALEEAKVECKHWEGWAYGTQTQKPAIEPIYLAQKPFSEKTGARNLLMHGVGALNIDGCRVPNEGGDHPLGRHPSNLILDGAEDTLSMFPKGNGDFFHHFPPDMDPIFYNPKAGKADRAGGKHPTVKPIALMQYLIRHITPVGGVVLDPFAGSGTTAQAALNEGFDCILMEAEPEYVEFLQDRFELRGKDSWEHDFDDIFGAPQDEFEDIFG